MFEIQCEDRGVVLEQTLDSWIYFAFGANVTGGYDAMTDGWHSFRYQIEDPLLRSDIEQVANSGCGDRFILENFI